MGDREASFARFYEESYDSVCRALTLAFGDVGLAEDAAQEAFTRAYIRWKRVAQLDRPAGWVYVTAFRVAMRHRRARNQEVDVRTEADVADQVVDRETMAEGIKALPERQRLAVVLRYGLDLSLKATATAMGCAVGTVKSTLHSALARLQVTLDVVSEGEHDGR